MTTYFFAPHPDDEIIGGHSVLDKIDVVCFFYQDYRQFSKGIEALKEHGKVVSFHPQLDVDQRYNFTKDDTIYIPSKYDHHPLHKTVNRIGKMIQLTCNCKLMYYSVEMNTPWLEVEPESDLKRLMFKDYYPGEYESMNKSDKYWLFQSVKPFDDIIWAVVRFQEEFFHCWPVAPSNTAYLRNIHRHMLHIEVRIQQFADDRDIEYIDFKNRLQLTMKRKEWGPSTSCEMVAMWLKSTVERGYPDRMVQVSVFEDGENGTIIE